MPLSIVCNNSFTDDKGKKRTCGQVEPFMDPKTEKVFCPNCDSELTVNHFTKVTLKNLKQFRQKTAIPFAVKCKNCNKESQPKVVGKDIICPSCNKKHEHLSEPFKIMLRDKLKTANKDIE